MSENIRTPKQQRSIETKNKIIEAGYKMFAEKGYFNTNTAEIAKHAGVSTGIIYGYFHDKRDILLDVLDIYISKAFEPVFRWMNAEPAIGLNDIIPTIIDDTVEFHKKNASIHEALHTLSFTDKVVNDKFLLLEEQTTQTLVEYLKKLGYDLPNLTEKVHLSIETVQSYAHECVYDSHPYIDYNEMRSLILEMILNLYVK